MKLKINGKIIEANPGEKVLDVLKREGISVPTLCQGEGLAPFGACRLCLVMVRGKPAVACSTPVSEGMEIETELPEIEELRKTVLELLVSDHYADCIAPCSLACPGKVDVQGYVGFTARGEFDSAVKLIRKALALPSSLGRVCPAFCEEAQCRRGIVEEPISIRNIKKFVADTDLFSKKPCLPPKKPSTGKRVAIIGSGPSGLSSAYFLSLSGHKAFIFEALPEPGGMLRYGIPAYRLPKDVLDREIELIKSLGVELKIGVNIGKDISLSELRKKYDAVFIGVGAGIGKSMRIPGEELRGVYQGVDFLRRWTLGEPLDIGKKVVVVGGGNTAIDSARTAMRMGAEVTIVYRRSRKEMPAHYTEVDDAEAEGIGLKLLTNPIRVMGNGRVSEIECIRMELGEPDESGRRRPIPLKGSEFRIKTDSIIMAIGQSVDLSFDSENEVSRTKWNSVEAGSEFLTNLPGVFAGGDAVRGPATVIEACYDGSEAAKCIDAYVSGNVAESPSYEFISKKGEFREIKEEEYEEYEKQPRLEPKKRNPKERKKDFAEIETGFTEKEAVKEAQRCIECGCMARYECDLKSYSTQYEAKQETYSGEAHHIKKDRRHPLIIRDIEKCILCGSCVRVCDETRHIGVFGFADRGFTTTIDTFFGESMLESYCESCGNCVDICPTGALWDKNILLKKPIPIEYEKTETVFPFCGYGCKLNLCVGNGRIEKSEGLKEGTVCLMGKFGPVLAQDEGRLINGIVNKDKDVGIKEAVEVTKKRLLEIKNIYGPDSIAFFISPGSLNEEIDELIKLAGGFGTDNLWTFSPDAGVISGGDYISPDWNGLSDYDSIILLGFDPWMLRAIPGLRARDAKVKGTRLTIIGYEDMLSVYRPDSFIPLNELKSKIENLKTELKKAKNPITLFNPGVDDNVLSLIKKELTGISIAPVYTKSNMRTLLERGIKSPSLDKKFKGIFIFGEDPIGLADDGKPMDFLSSAEFLCVCDLFLTETAKLADVVIPKASFAEIEGSYTNMMGKTQKVKRAIKPLSGWTNLELLKMLNKDGGTGGKKTRNTSPLSHPSIRIKCNADSLENRVKERLKKLGLINIKPQNNTEFH